MRKKFEESESRKKKVQEKNQQLELERIKKIEEQQELQNLINNIINVE